MNSGFSMALMRVILGHICLHGCMAGSRLAAPLLALKLGHSPVAVGVMLSMFALMQVFLSIPAGRFADRHGLRRPVGFAVMAACLGAGLSALFPVFPVLCLCALLTGGATGSAIIALQRHVGRAAENPTQLKEVFSWISIGPAASNFLGPVLAGLLIDHAGSAPGDMQGYRIAFGVMAVLPLLTWFCVRTTPDLVSKAVEGAGKRRAWDLLRMPMFRRLLFVNWMLSACWDVHTLAVPLLGHELGFSASVIGAILGAFAITAVGVRLVLPHLAAHLREWAVISLAMAATALLFVVYPLLQSPWAMGFCSVLLGVSLGVVQPMILSTLHQITPEARQGEALGIRLMFVNVSSVAMPMLFGATGAAVGVAAVFWVIAASVGLGVPQAWRLRADHK